MSPPHLHHGVRVVLDFVLCGKLVRSTNALYAISFRRCRILLSASFRFHLTMDTLAVQLMVPTTKPIADFHRLVTAHAGQTTKASNYRLNPGGSALFLSQSNLLRTFSWLLLYSMNRSHSYVPSDSHRDSCSLQLHRALLIPFTLVSLYSVSKIQCLVGL